MANRAHIGHTTAKDGNVFLDLGFEPDEAAALLQQSNHVIEGKRAARRVLVDAFESWCSREHLSVEQVASRFSLPMDQAQQVLSGDAAGISTDKLLSMVLRTGQTVKVSAS